MTHSHFEPDDRLRQGLGLHLRVIGLELVALIAFPRRREGERGGVVIGVDVALEKAVKEIIFFKEKPLEDFAKKKEHSTVCRRNNFCTEQG